MNRRHIRPCRAPLGDLGLIPLTTLVLLMNLSAHPASAQSGSGARDLATPASETQHTTEEEPTEPADASPTLPPDQEALALKIFNELISPCCWTTTVAQHGSGAAPRIQGEVRRMLASGMGRQAILDHYVQEYGERILASPKKKGFNLAVYLVPPFGLAAGALLIAMASRRKGRGRAPVVSTAGPRGGASGPTEPAAPPKRPAPGSEEDYRRRIEEEVRRSS
jgi:cytochrome c-type biogenesis protein CcmH/NrfF